MPAPDLAELDSGNIVDFIADIFARRGAEEYIGEKVSIAEHMLQCAEFAQKAGAEDDVIAAALLHDIGHFTSEFGTFTMDDTEDRYHEDAGAQLLEQFFPTVVTDCVRFHVAAKRYLCATRQEYFDLLSEASVHSLNLQGGPMSAAEVEAFEKNPNLGDIIKVRYLDDAGKDPEMTTPGFAHFAPMVRRVVERHCG